MNLWNELLKSSNRFFWFMIGLLVMFLCLVMPFTLRAAEYDIEIQYSYVSPDETMDAVSFKIYAEGTYVCTTTPGTNGDIVACNATTLRPGPYNWTMTALYADGRESPASAPYAFTLPMPDPNQPNIILMRLREAPAPAPPQ